MPPKLPDPLPLETLEIDTQVEAQNIRKPGEAVQLSDSDTSSSNEFSEEEEEFDWEKDDEANSKGGGTIEAKRGRRVWLAFMKLSRPIRVFLIALLGVGVLITPLIVVNVRFPNNPVKVQVHVWSLWLTINWATSCGTYLLVDAIPHLVIAVTSLFGGQVERLKIQIEVNASLGCM
jgi:hypothetical protein